MAFLLGTACPRAAARELSFISRSFSTTHAALNQVPPESPAYIRLPTPPQSEEKKLPRVRGHLPVPREVFPREEGERKVQPSYMEETAPRRKLENYGDLKSPADLWKRKMADNRRHNLGVGLKELWNRRRQLDSRRNARVSKKFEEHNAAASAPEREDDRLTRSTVLESIMDTTVYPDPKRFSKCERSKSRVLAIEASKREARRDALMELYINASSFILNEAELKAEIDTVFAEDYFKKQGQAMGRYGHAENTWDIWGKPPTVGDMLETSTGASTKIMNLYESEYDRSVKRQKRIAEEFTGGKME
ncbi:hypothetical protein EDB81DRAFT_441879 [Dactylonectria macrodidyma]|uniref:Uncharacterized protein n=1 Tax=Dactylonectria macrodidyma TaxID=307937 RepID=A0A9P9F5H5_9HYPO|nr:hypothetical protein EDB81DRAFT_441879 [Dactylonectria macrodidyma]